MKGVKKGVKEKKEMSNKDWRRKEKNIVERIKREK